MLPGNHGTCCKDVAAGAFLFSDAHVTFSGSFAGCSGAPEKLQVPLMSTLSPVISHIALSVSNLERSTRFYGTVLQLPPLEEPFKIGMHSWFALGHACQLHLIATEGTVAAQPINHHLALRTNSFDALVQRLSAHGIVYGSPFGEQGVVHIRPDGIRQIFFQDPDGYWLELNDEPVP